MCVERLNVFPHSCVLVMQQEIHAAKLEPVFFVSSLLHVS